MTRQRKVAFYFRVSTVDQTTENQRRDLINVAERANWAIVEIYEDAGISGAKGRDKRPAFNKLLKDAARRKFDIIAVWSVDRLGRSLQDLVSFLSDIHSYGIDLYLHQQGIDTTTPAGKAMFQMLGVFSEFERSIIRDRVKAGLARAKAKGVVLGRPQTDKVKEMAIIETLKMGHGILKTAKLHGVGTSVVQRIKNTEIDKVNLKNIAGNDVSIFLFRFELRGYGIDFVLNEAIAEDMYPDIEMQMKPLAIACCETLVRYKHLSVGNTIMDSNILVTGELEFMLSKGLGQYFVHDEKQQLFQNAKAISDLLIMVMNRRSQEMKKN